MTDAAILDAVRFAGEQSEYNPFASPEEIALVLGVAASVIQERLREMAACGLLSLNFVWHNTTDIKLPNIQHPTVGYDKSRPLFRAL